MYFKTVEAALVGLAFIFLSLLDYIAHSFWHRLNIYLVQEKYEDLIDYYYKKSVENNLRNKAMNLYSEIVRNP